MVSAAVRVLACGGRDYFDTKAVFRALDAVHAKHTITLLIHGDAPGADRTAEAWAKKRQVPYLGVPAMWDKLKKAAGYERNGRMLLWAPEVVIAFPGGKGTANMIEQADRAGVRVWEPAAPGPLAGPRR